MKAGGNAVDGAVATSLVLGVVAPAFSGIGGGGFLMVHLRDQETLYIDYRETAPRRAGRGMFQLDGKGGVKGSANSVGYRAVAVPGTVAGLSYALELYGSMKFAEVASQAISFARHGFEVSNFLGAVMSDRSRDAAQKIKRFPESRKEWLKGDRPYKAGEKKLSPNFAEVLEKVARDGLDSFYRGEVAEAIARDMSRKGGLIDKEDLAEYSIEVRKPVKGTYRGYEVHAMSPPSLGGTALIQLLNIFEDLDMGEMGSNSAETIAAMARALSAVWPELRRRVGDPSFVKVDTGRLVSKGFAARLVSGQRTRRVREDDSGRSWTTHLSVVDKDRNVAAITESLECYFGSGVIVPGTGFFLNDTMHDFDPRPEGPNSVAPGKRPVSNMTPTLLLKDGSPYLVAGSAAGPRIVTATLQTILNVVDHQMDVQDAVDAPRFHYEGTGPLKLESRIGTTVRRRLRRLGFDSESPNYVQLKRGYDAYFGGVNAVLIGDRGELSGGADSRRQGSVAAY
jgi:gamma-glutamyltranspeptidase/glutathione hydrolase